MPVTWHFDNETRIHRIDGTSRTGGTDDTGATGVDRDMVWQTEITSHWNIGDKPNGGYLLAPLQRAMQIGSGHPDPLTITAHYLRPGEPGPARVEVELVRPGRTVSTMRGRLVQGGKTKLEAIAAFTDLTTGSHILDLGVEPPDIPPPDECPSRAELTQGVDVTMMGRIDMRVHPDHALGDTGREPVIAGWIRFADERPVDAASLTLFTDTFPPPLFATLGPVGWVPTIELTTHVRRRPVEGWLLGRFRTSDAAGPRVIEEGHIWDSSGQVVAMARQVGLILAPPSA